MTANGEQMHFDIEPEEPGKDQEQVPNPDIGEDINVTTIAAVGLVTTIAVIAVIMLLVGLYYQAERGEVQSKYNASDQIIHAELQLEQAERLGSYGWADVEAGAVSIPIDQAMLIVATELAREQAVQTLGENRGANSGAAGESGGEY